MDLFSDELWRNIGGHDGKRSRLRGMQKELARTGQTFQTKTNDLEMGKILQRTANESTDHHPLTTALSAMTLNPRSANHTLLHVQLTDGLQASIFHL